MTSWDPTQKEDTGAPTQTRPTAPPTAAPATDEQVAVLTAGIRDARITNYQDVAAWSTLSILIARIDSDRARIREQAEENERLRSALINLRAKCLEMGWEPRSPQLMDAAAALFSKPEPASR